MSGNDELDNWIVEETDVIIKKSSGKTLIGNIKSISDNGIWITFVSNNGKVTLLTASSIDSINKFDGRHYCHD